MSRSVPVSAATAKLILKYLYHIRNVGRPAPLLLEVSVQHDEVSSVKFVLEDLLDALQTRATRRIFLGEIAGQLHAFHVRGDIFDLRTTVSDRWGRRGRTIRINYGQ